MDVRGMGRACPRPGGTPRRRAARPIAALAGLARPLVLGSLLAVGAGALLPSVAQAAFRGSNGPIVFESGRTASVPFCPSKVQGGEIFVLPAGAADPVQLTCTSAQDETPVVSPDGTKVVFASTRNGSNPQLFTVPLGTPPSTTAVDPTLVSGSPKATDQHPSWSPAGDGTIVFQRSLPGQLAQLYIENVATPSAAIPVFSSPTGFMDTEPVFDPSDVAVVVFVRPVDGHTHIFSYDLSTHTLVDLSAQGNGGGAGNDVHPQFSPVSGGRIAFQSDRACGLTQLYTMSAQGTDQDAVFRKSDNSQQCTTENDGNPVYSPAGDALAYDRPGFKNTAVREPFQVSVNSSGAATDPPVILTDNAAANTEPDWGPEPVPPNQAPEVPLPVILPVATVLVGVTVVAVQRRRLRAARR